mmetsp:Transcript_60087/g.143170  ORF Transcript_60087/g.143170 Transcript_60087/m.143170 type:complete len:1566 (+) Transcript_60087:92-4789(+)
MEKCWRKTKKTCCGSCIEVEDSDEDSELEGEDREVPFGRLYQDIGSDYPSNAVRTSKYTPWSFFPKNLFEQVIRFTNAYFIILIALMFLGTPYTDLYVSPSSPFGTAVTLAALMAFTMVVAAFDDVQRCRADREMNERPAMQLRGNAFQEEEWQDVEVGDVIMIRKGEELPSDVVLLAASSENGECFVSTMNLDGETNLKIKRAPAPMQDRLLPKGRGTPESAAAALGTLGGVIKSGPPSRNIHHFSGMINLQGAQDIPLTIDNLLLRGTSLQNTAWIMGITLFTGKETRIRRNATDPKYKRSNIDRYINQSVLVVLIVQIIISLISAIVFASLESEFADYWYIFPGDSDLKDWFTLPSWIAFFFTFFILYANLMPIALLASMEFVNLFQKMYIQQDLRMYDHELDVRARVRTANLCQEIGQVSYIFSDKTGTLTRNVMELKLISVGGKTYGTLGEEPGFQGVDQVKQASQGNEAMDNFWEAVATCHTVVTSQNEDGSKKYEAESPDESALVESARAVGWDFQDKQHGKMFVNSPKGPKEYEVLAVNPFNSDRKRASLLLKTQSGEHLLVAKGADNVMLERSRGGQNSIGKDLHDFSTQGLRTLVVGRRRVDPGEAQSWLREYNEASVAIHGREEKMAAAAEKIERDFEILGVTGVEDKLQENVQETIVSIRRAGIHLWVLTGDKLETAKNIGFSTKVLSNDMDILIFDSPGSGLIPDIRNGIARAKRDVASKQTVAMMITGGVLSQVTKEGFKEDLLELAELCSVVIACRVSPLQKAELVKLVRKGITPQPVTLAVGDGANDVPMIMTSQVGVGISGREGRQAVNSADFAITQFQFLQRLLLIHGRWNYRRVAKLIIYTYWKSVLVTWILFFYQFYNGFSATAAFTGLLWLSYSWWTSVGIVAVAVSDQDLTEEQCLKYPGLYDTGRLALDFNTLKVVEMLISSFIHSIIIFFIFVAAVPSFEALGRGGFVTWGTAMYTGLIVNVTWRLIYITTTWNWVIALAEFLPVLLYIIFLAIYAAWPFWIPIFDTWWMNFFFVAFQMVNQWMFWIVLLTLPLLAGSLDTFREFLILQFLPDRRDLIHEEASKDVPDLKPLEEDCYKTDLPQDHKIDHTHHQPGFPNNGNNYFAYSTPQPAYPSFGSQPYYGGGGVPSFYNPTMLSSTPSRFSGRGFSLFMLRHDSPQVLEDEDDISRSEVSADKPENYPDDSDFWQQTIPSYQSVSRWETSLCCTCTSSIILLIFGIIALVHSLNVDQIVVQYSGDEDRPLGVHEDSFTYSECKPQGFNTTTCCINITAAKDLDEPVELYYIIDPYYQNYIFYQQSNLWREQHGNAFYPSDDGELRNAYCKPDEARDIPDEGPNGKPLRLYPCGLHTYSFFNDTYWIVGKDIDDQSIAWPTDEKVNRNPDFYPDDDRYEFVFQRFPNIISEEDGVRNPHYLVWIRLAALDYVYKRYGSIEDKISEGEELTICINASYPLDEKKYLYLSEVTGLGGRNDALGITLIVCAGLAILATLLMIAVILCCRRELGEPRFEGGTRETFFRQARNVSAKNMSALCAGDSDSEEEME